MGTLVVMSLSLKNPRNIYFIEMDNNTYQKNIWENFEGNFMGSKLAKLIHFLAGRYIRDGILDVGAGDGSLVLGLQKKGYKKVVGIDQTPKVDFVKHALVSHLPFEDESFETVLSTEVFEHLDKKQINEGLKEIYRVLKKNRYFIITVPFEENFARNEINCPHCNTNFHRYGHLQYFDKHKMKTLLENHGFQVVSSKEYSFGPMAAHPLFKYFNFVYKRYRHLHALSQTLVTIAKKS
jgi:SAM-dependent methyltransferase